MPKHHGKRRKLAATAAISVALTATAAIASASGTHAPKPAHQVADIGWDTPPRPAVDSR